MGFFRKIAWTLLLACGMMPGLQAQEMIDFPAQPITEFPFQMLTGGVIIISAKVDVIPDSLHFVLDTGSGGISLDSSTVEIYNVETEPSDRIIRGIAGIRKVEFANNLKLFLPGLTVEGLNFHVNDYQILTEVHGMKIDGIIGYSLLSRYIVKVDYDKKTIAILEPGYIRYPRGGTVLKPTLGTIPIVRATSLSAREIYARYYFDTGAGLNVLFNSAFVRDSSIFSKNRRLYPTVAQGLGGKAFLDMAIIRRFRLGRYTFRKVPIHIFNDDFNVTSYPFLVGLIGNDLLRRFNLIINYPQGEIHMLPNSAFNDSFDYSYSGLGLINYGGHIEVSDVLPGSPAEAAGLLPGDRILSVGNHLNNHLPTYRTALQVPSARVRILAYRNNQLFETWIKVARVR